MHSKTSTFKIDNKVFFDKNELYEYINNNKLNDKSIINSLGWKKDEADPARYWFYLKYGKSKGTSVISKKETKWNKVTERYERFNEDERDIYIKQFQDRMKNKFGITHLTKLPEKQKEMLGNRSISKEYKWNDGSITNCTGEYELDFLKYIETFHNFNKTMMSEPPTIYYSYENEKKFYLPDFFIPSLNLIVEIKGSNNHYQKRDSHLESLKKSACISEGFDFIQVNDKNYTEFKLYLEEILEETE